MMRSTSPIIQFERNSQFFVVLMKIFVSYLLDGLETKRLLKIFFQMSVLIAYQCEFVWYVHLSSSFDQCFNYRIISIRYCDMKSRPTKKMSFIWIYAVFQMLNQLSRVTFFTYIHKSFYFSKSVIV